MNIRKLSSFVALCTLLPIYAAQAHEPQSFDFGSPGKASEVTRTIHVKATDQMRLVFEAFAAMLERRVQRHQEHAA